MTTTANSQTAFEQIICPLDLRRGAPMGRSNVGVKPEGVRIFDRKVPLYDGAYDKGGAYWGMGTELRVSFTADLSYINFYRVGQQ